MVRQNYKERGKSYGTGVPDQGARLKAERLVATEKCCIPTGVTHSDQAEGELLE